ncbi:hypothetical protein ALPO108162_12955 [Alicyclobacillus pomorum]
MSHGRLVRDESHEKIGGKALDELAYGGMGNNPSPNDIHFGGDFREERTPWDFPLNNKANLALNP